MRYIVNPSELTEIVLNQSETVKSVLQNVACILSTYKGEVPCDREYGISPEILHRPINVAKTMLLSEVSNQIQKYEPRATVKSVSVTISESDASILQPTVEVEIDE